MIQHLKAIAFVFAGMLAATGMQAQGQAKKVSLDKIMAVVSDKIVLQSDVDNIIADAKRSGQPLPPNARCMVLEQNLLQKILALQAVKDSLPVSDEDVEAQLDAKLRENIMQYGSVQMLEELAGKTVYQLKDDSRPLVKDQMLGDAMRRKIFETVHITPTEVNAFFSKVPQDSLPFLESEIEVGQISILPTADKGVEQYIYDEMMGYRKQIESGVRTFADMAKRYSEDPGSRERGGTYEINRSDKNTWDPVFLQTAFRLKTGEISTPVRSKNFGYFLIKMDDRRGDDAKISMILRVPPITESELEPAQLKLDSVRQEILDGKISFKDAAYKYSQDENVKSYGPFILGQGGTTFISYDMLDKDAIPLIKDMKVGDISKPAVFQNERGKKGVRLLYLKSRTEPHRLNLADDYTRIAEMALSEKKSLALDKWLTKVIPTYHILISKEEVSECEGLKKYEATDGNGF